MKKEKTYRIKTNNQELLIRKQNESDATSWWKKNRKLNWWTINVWISKYNSILLSHPIFLVQFLFQEFINSWFFFNRRSYICKFLEWTMAGIRELSNGLINPMCSSRRITRSLLQAINPGTWNLWTYSRNG